MRSPRRPPGGLPIGFAHRGARAECPDNTLVSFVRALELGARGLESDAWVTADGAVVLDHDGIVRRGVRRVAIGDVRRAELPAHMPTLTDLLALTDDAVEISLDVKDPATAQPTIALVEAVGRAERTWLCGRGDALLGWRRHSVRVRLVESTRIQRIPEGLGACVERLAAGGIDAVNLRWAEWDPARVDVVHDAGLLAFAWDTQRAATMATMVHMGIDAVYSDHVARMVEVLSASGAGPSRPT